MNVLVGVVLIIWGIINIVSPETGWHLSDGWKYRDAEPSDEALIWGRICGLGMVIGGIYMVFFMF